MTGTVRYLASLAGLLAVAVAAGCGGAGGGGGGGSRVPSAAADPSAGSDVVGEVSTSCTLYLSGADARVTFDGQASAQSCRSGVQNWSDANAFWAVGNPPPTGALATVCSLQAPDASVSVTVEDSGGALSGTSICGTLAHAGWTQNSAATGAGPAAQQADDQAAVDDLAKSLTGDVAKLADLDAELSSQWQSVAASLSQLRSDEAGIVKDAADAKASHCATFPRFPDSSDIGVAYIRSLVGDLRTLDRGSSR